MEKKQKTFYILLVVSTSIFVCFATIFYAGQLKKTISDNIIESISEIAEHDKASIQSYITSCWRNLYEINGRFTDYDCQTIQDIKKILNLECASSRFSHIYLVMENGTIYTNQYITYTPKDHAPDFLSYFTDGKTKIVARFENDPENNWLETGSILYGIRLKDCEIAGEEISALIGISNVSLIRDHMVIDSFTKNGKSRGHSALIDMNGNYIVDINKEPYVNRWNNLFEHLSASKDSEFTNEEIKKRLANLETFGFYHSHKKEKTRELYYFIPFGNEMDLYFIMSVSEEVLLEQTKTFTTMSIVMLAISMLAVVIMLLIVMKSRIKTIRTTVKAKSQKEFLSNMSHEIRTPLNGLIGINHLITLHIDDDSKKTQIKELLKKSQSTADYLLSLVNDILDMSKLQAGKVDLISEPLLIEELMDEVAAMQTANIESRGVSFLVEKNITEPCVEGDAVRTKQILMNIVGNAAKFTPSGKSIRFSVSQKPIDDTHVLTIYQCEDTGIGISKEYIGKIFDSFSQEKNRNTSGMKGTGLGMAISKLLANAMNGDITVESELNVGSTFTVTIPSVIVKDIPDYLKDDKKELAEETIESLPDRNHRRSIKILLAEDVELNAEILLEILDLEGFETAHAQNGREALELFQQSALYEFDVILMDMKMPVMDGCSASREIRNLDRPDAKSVVIYACTANTFQEDRDLAIESGMNDFLTKPIDVAILLKKLESIAK